MGIIIIFALFHARGTYQRRIAALTRFVMRTMPLRDTSLSMIGEMRSYAGVLRNFIIVSIIVAISEGDVVLILSGARRISDGVTLDCIWLGEKVCSKCCANSLALSPSLLIQVPAGLLIGELRVGGRQRRLVAVHSEYPAALVGARAVRYFSK